MSGNSEVQSNSKARRSDWNEGLRHGFPIACGYFFVSFTFGILGATLGFRWWETVLISMTNLTSAGQIAGVKTIAAGGSVFELALSQFIINLRYSLMGISLSQNMSEDVSGPRRMLLGFGITDEIYGVAASRRTPVTTPYFVGLMTLPYAGWTLGTLGGAVLGDVLPKAVTNVMTLAIYGMFIAIVVPAAKESRKVLFVALAAAAVSCLMYYAPVLKEVSVGFAIIVSAVVAAAVGAWLFPVEDGPRETAEEGGACRE
ncbi:MAG: AzlC family ABC transporter permease [Lachnospiraceae bacterium]|nr:AzlC family ABC transporter permease [Lachnospiraceae bacterium]